MEPERWKRIEDLFHRAAQLAGAERGELLDRECAGDPELRAAVDQLLSDDEREGDLFDRLDTSPGSLPPDPNVGRVLGAYRLTARLAEGGMGLVYHGARSDGLFEQEVAVKLIRVERATDDMIRRFEFERRTLASLSHTSIARLYDGGTSEEGFPYLVMEYIRGEPIDEYCDRRHLPVEARLRLFTTVCRAVHFAHQNLIIHRDLKPGNILIDEQGVPKLLDFGIARLVDDGGTESAPPLTRTLSRILTPEYASPEQLGGGPATTAVDVYALGVILYGLLTGKRPFRCDSRSPLEWHRMVLEDQPVRPSTAVVRGEPVAGEGPTPDDLARRCGATPGQLRRRLRGDLDRIVLMALRKEPERRFASVQELADDVERHLAGQPVLACEDSLRYRTGKFVRRNRLAVSAAAAVLLALVFGLVAARRGERAAQEQARHARIEADSFHGIADFLLDTFLASRQAQDRAWREEQLQRILVQAEQVRRQHPEDPHLRANLLDELGNVCLRLDLLAEAEPLLQEALEIRLATFGPKTLEAALSHGSLGHLEYARGDHGAAAAHLVRALELHRSLPGETHTDVATAANDLAAALRNAGRVQEAWELHQEALALRRADGSVPLAVAESLNNMAGIQLHRGELEEAVESLSEALEIRRAVLGEGHELTLQTQSNLATATWHAGAHDEARRLLVEAVAGLRALRFGARQDLERALANLSQLHVASGDPDRAEPLLAEALELGCQRLGRDHPDVTTTRQKLAVLLHRQGRDQQAAAHWEQVIAQRRDAASTPVLLGRSLYEYGLFLMDMAQLDTAEQVLHEAVQVLAPLAPDDPAAFGRAEAALGVCLMRAGQPAEAARRMAAGLELLEGAPTVSDAERTALRDQLEGLGAPAPAGG